MKKVYMKHTKSEDKFNSVILEKKGYSDFVVVFHIMKFSSLKRKIITHCFY